MVVSDVPDFPRVDDHLVHPETREELIRGHLMLDPPAEPPHGDRRAASGPMAHGTLPPAHAEASALARGLAKGIVAVCDVLEIPLDADRLLRMESLDVAALEALLTAISTERRWP
jgi:hypothetical protein